MHFDVKRLSETTGLKNNQCEVKQTKTLVEYIRKHAAGLLRLREQHTPPRSVIVIVVSLQLMHFLIHAHGGKLAII